MEISVHMKLSVIMFLISYNIYSVTGVNESVIIVVLPDSSNGVQTSLEKSEEILPKVEAAINCINNDSTRMLYRI